MKKIYHDKEVIVWERKIYNVPNDLSDSEIVDKIRNEELELESFEYKKKKKNYEGGEEIFDVNNRIIFSK